MYTNACILSSRRRHTRWPRDWSSDVCSSDLVAAQLDAPAWVLIPAMLFIAAGMGFGLVGLQYAAVTGVTDDDAGVASGVQRAADQLGGPAGVPACVGSGFGSIAHGVSPYLLSSGLAIIGLGVAAFVARRVAVSDEHTTEQGVNTEA